MPLTSARATSRWLRAANRPRWKSYDMTRLGQRLEYAGNMPAILLSGIREHPETSRGKLAGMDALPALIPRPRRVLAPGAVHVPDWLDPDRQRALVRACREWAAEGPGIRAAA